LILSLWLGPQLLNIFPIGALCPGLRTLRSYRRRHFFLQLRINNRSPKKHLSHRKTVRLSNMGHISTWAAGGKRKMWGSSLDFVTDPAAFLRMAVTDVK
jgi:hypothetical protein